ncbi:MAG: hypothetical protein A2033_04545 [Bacteroidetes bacterium GWA2_31_9]|nr:MAG: hypothetical protein A2033_04545 [Bacteroidetes bacterium GWA2_31_9]
MNKQLLILIAFFTISFFACNQASEKPKPKIIQEQDSLLKIIDERDSLVIISNDSLNVRTVKPDTE